MKYHSQSLSSNLIYYIASHAAYLPLTITLYPALMNFSSNSFINYVVPLSYYFPYSQPPPIIIISFIEFLRASWHISTD